MTALASLSDLVTRLTGGSSGTPENIFWFKNPSIAGALDTWAAGFLYSAWKYDGFPGGASTPGAVAAPTGATAGAMPITNPGGGREKFLVSAGVMAVPQTVPYVMIYDRLLHIGGFDGTNTGAQNVGGSLTRYTDGIGNMLFVEINTAVGTTARTITASYSNTVPTSGRTTTSVAFGGTVGTLGNDANLFIPLPLQAGDLGVSAVASATIGTGSTGTAGNFGVVVAHPIALIPLDGSGGAVRSFANGMPGLPEIQTDACLAVAFYAASSTESPISGALGLVEA